MKVPKTLAERFKKALNTQETYDFTSSWLNNDMTGFLHTVGKANKEQIDRIYMNGVVADLSAFSEKGWSRNVLTNGYHGSTPQNPITEEWLNFARGSGLFDGTEGVYKNLARSNGFTIRSKKDAINAFNNRGQPTPSKPVPEKTVTPVENEQPTISPEELARKNGFSLSSDGKIISPSSKQQGKPGAVTQEDVKRVQEQYNNRLGGEQARQNNLDRHAEYTAKRETLEQKELNKQLTGNAEKSGTDWSNNSLNVNDGFDEARALVKSKENIAAENARFANNYYEKKAEQFFKNPEMARVAAENNLEQNAESMWRIKNILNAEKNAGPIQQQFLAERKKALGVGSGETLQEGTLKYAYDPEKVSDTEKMSGISDLGFSSVDKTNGMKIAARELSIDEAKLKGLIKQNDMPGTKAANDMLYGRVEKGLNSQYASIMKSNLSNDEKIAKWKTAREEAIERLKNGATFQDYFFGNRVHHGLAGMAAITGTLGVAFGGHKSNAELYSSPF